MYLLSYIHTYVHVHVLMTLCMEQILRKLMIFLKMFGNRYVMNYDASNQFFLIIINKIRQLNLYLYHHYKTVKPIN